MKARKILIIEDEEDILALIHYNLTREGYQPTGAMTGEEGLAAARNQRPDLILLDLMLPGIDGIEVCRRLRAAPETADVPIIMLTAKGEEADIIRGLEVGADDYMTKPFGSHVLLARIKSVLRRAGRSVEGEQEKPLEFTGLMIHPGRNEVLVDGAATELTFSEFKLLYFLARRPGWVFTRSQIVDAVHGQDYPVTDRSVDVLVVGLRKKLGKRGRVIETVRGIGYRFSDS
ncbi:MAG: response regulator transcription factor [Desulfuromonadales bacterium]|nr:response regulator transcription factor [Desulfuromonadales bacterium]